MIFDKKKGSLLNYIQLPLHVITPYGTYLGTGYDDNNKPTYILSHIKVSTERLEDLTFSSLSKDAIIEDNTPILTKTDDNIIGYNYKISETELKYGYITVASTRIDISQNKITKDAAAFILEKQLRNIGNILEKYIHYVRFAQPQYDAMLYYFFNLGVSKIENSSVMDLINAEDWFNVTDEIQADIKTNNGRVDEQAAVMIIKTAKMFSYVPGF